MAKWLASVGTLPIFTYSITHTRWNVIARHFSKRSFPSFAVCQSERHPESYGDIEDEDVRLSAALNGTDDAEAQASHNGDAPGMEGCNDGGSSPSNKDGEAVPRARVSSRF